MTRNDFYNKLKLIISIFLGKNNYKWIMSDWLKLKDLDAVSKVLSTERFSRNLKTILVEPNPSWKNLLIIAPHQDDETIGAGGTLLIAKEMGVMLHCLYLTSGSDISNDSSNNLADIRREEAQKCWDFIKGDPTFFNYYQSGIPLNEAAAKRLAEFINQLQPEVIFLPFLLDDQDDHRRANHLLMLSSKYILNKKIEIWAYAVWSSLIPNVAVDISNVIEQKKYLNSFWISQNRNRDYVHLSTGFNIYSTKFITMKPIPKYVEAFFSVPFDEYIKLCELYFLQPFEKIYYDLPKWEKIMKQNNI